MALNITGAVNRLISNAHSSSTGYCAMYVRLAMEAGGLSTLGRPDWAWKYINWLPSQGWSHIATLSSRSEQSLFTTTQAQLGDVAVYQKPGYGTSAPGHICMWSGKNWISDFVQNNMSVYLSRGEVTAYIFRYTGEISNSGDLISPTFINSASFSSTGTSTGGNVSSLINGQANTVYQLASSGERDDVLKISDNRKSQFESLRNTLKSNMIDMGRDVVESPEMYNSSILKTSQSAKKERT